MKMPVKPTLTVLKVDGRLDSKATVIPDEYNDLYTKKMKTFGKTEIKIRIGL